MRLGNQYDAQQSRAAVPHVAHRSELGHVLAGQVLCLVDDGDGPRVRLRSTCEVTPQPGKTTSVVTCRWQ